MALGIDAASNEHFAGAQERCRVSETRLMEISCGGELIGMGIVNFRAGEGRLIAAGSTHN